MPFCVIRNDITNMKADAIVNTANPMPIFSQGTDNAIYRKAGAKELLSARRKIGIIKRGDAEVTPAFGLQAKYIIHTVGPVWKGGNHGEMEILRSCYENSLKKALEYDCKSIAFPLISSGSYGYPKDKALQVAMSVLQTFAMDHDMQIYLVVFGAESFELSGRAFGQIQELINDTYVREAEDLEYENCLMMEDLCQSSDRQFEEESAYDRASNRRRFYERCDEGEWLACLDSQRIFENACMEKDAAKDAAKDAVKEASEESVKIEQCERRKTAARPSRQTKPPMPCAPAAKPYEQIPQESAPDMKFSASPIAPMPCAPNLSSSARKKSASASKPSTETHNSMGYSFGWKESPQKSTEKVGRVPLSELEKMLAINEMTFQEKLFEYIDASGLKNSQIYKPISISKQTFSKIQSNRFYQPAKRTAILFCLVLHLNLDETVDLLGRAGLSLSNSNRSDVVITACIKFKEYDINSINLLMIKNNCEPLFSETA